MPGRVERRTVDLSAYPDLVVIYLGQRVRGFRGLRTMFGFGSAIGKAVAEQPDGLLRHETIWYSIVPPHAGMRQYWRDFDALERWARSLPHRDWWKRFLRDSGGTGFWHEAYFMRGGMEAVYDDMPGDLGFLSFAPSEPARGRMFSARTRARVEGEPELTPGLTEDELYAD
jgi:hypothetical protein